MRASLLPVAVAIALAPKGAWASPRTVSGTVVSEANDPVPGARVTVVDAWGKVVGTAITDLGGRWKLTVDVEAGSTVVARVDLEGFPPVSTKIRADQVSVRTTIHAASNAAIDLEVQGDKIFARPEPDKPTRYTLESTLLTKLPGTRGDPFAAVTSMPSMGRPPALSTVYVVRGAGPEETVTFVDGAPMHHAFHFGGLVSVIPGAFVQSIAVLPGGFGVPFGRATAGVIDVALASPRSDGVHGAINLDAIDIGAVLSAPLVPGRKDTTIALGARRSHVDAWIGRLLGDAVAGDLPRYLDGQVVVQHEIGPKSRIRAAFLAADDNVAVSDPSAPPDRPRAGSWHSDVMRVHARYEATVGSTGGVLAVASASKSTDRIIGENDLWETGRRTFFTRLEGTLPIDGAERARLTLGTDTLATRVEGTRVLGIPTSSFGGSAVFQLRGVVVVERIEPGVYTQLAFEPIKGIVLVSGLRFDRAPRGEALWQPRFSLRAELDKQTAFKASAGLYARSNPFDAVDARDHDGTLLPVPVEAGPVRGAQGAIGVEQVLTKNVMVSIDAYARTSHGRLVPVQQPAHPLLEDRLAGGQVLVGYHYALHRDDGRSRAMGTEVLLRFQGASYAGFVGYALARAEVRDGPHGAWRRAPFDQTHVLNAAGIVKLGAGWEMGARFRLAIGVLDSPYPATDIAPKNDPNLDPNRALPQLAPLHSLDLRLEKGWTIGQSGSVAVYAEVRNVYDRRAREPLAYNHVYGYPVVGNGLPIIPNLGVKGAF